MSMRYMLNGGRNERGVLVSPTSLALYKELEIKRVLFIVYALAEDFWQNSWKRAGSLIQIPGMELRSLTVYDSDAADIIAALQWADFIYLPGGSQEVLLKRMHQLGTDQALTSVLSGDSLKILGGGSAGAMVMGSWCIIGRNEVKAVVPGLNCLAGYVVDSHFSERERLPRLQAVLQNLTDMTGIGIDEDTVLIMNNEGKPEAVYGPGTVTVCDNKITIYDNNSTFSI